MMEINEGINTIKPQTASSFLLKEGQILKIIDIQGCQVSDMLLFNYPDFGEKLSSGKTFDFEETILITKGNHLWSNRSRKMATILEDTNGRNDFLLAPCSSETFEIMYNYKGDHPSCFGNFTDVLADYGIAPDDIPTAFNVFMNVKFDDKGKVTVHPPTSKAGDYLIIKAHMNLIVALTACSAEDSNGGSFKPIGYKIII